MSKLPKLTIKQVAKAIGVHPKTIRRWEDKSLISPLRTIGNQRRFSRTDLKTLHQIKSGNFNKGDSFVKELTLKQTAEKLGVHPITVRRWTKQNKLKKPYTQSQIDKLKTPYTSSNYSIPEQKQNNSSIPKHLVYLTLAGIILAIGLSLYSLLKSPTKIASPSIEQLDITKRDIEVALPRIANFLDGQITIGIDSGTLSFLDQNGNLYIKNNALIKGMLNTSGLQLLPSEQPEEKQIGQQYVNASTGNLMYYDGLDWISLNQTASSSSTLQDIYNTGQTTLIAEDQNIDLTLGNSASASATSLKLILAGDTSSFEVLGGASQSLIKFDDNATYPVNISQPTQILGNLYAPKLTDTADTAYFIDPANTGHSLNLAGDASISATLKFTKNNGYITNDTNNYITLSGGLGINGNTQYGFNTDSKLLAKNGQFTGDVQINNLNLKDNTFKATNDSGIYIYDNNSNGLYLKDGGNLGIGTTNPAEKLEVVGNIRVTEGSFIDDGTTLDVPDYVFENDYQLLSPVSLQEFISTYHHLPGVPSINQVKQNGLNLSRFSLNLLEKIENNVLYIMDLYDRVTQLEQRFSNPSVETQHLTTNFISPLTDNGEDIPGTEPGISTLSGTLTANEIKSSTIDSIQNKIAKLAEDYQTQTATASADLANLTSEVELDTSGVYTATDSAHLAIDSLNANFGFFSDYLAVMGQTVTTDLKVNNLLTVQDNLIIGSSSITSLSGNLDLMAGLITLNTNGKVVINGDLTITGKLATGTLIASEIQSPFGETLDIKIASQSAVSIYNTIGDQVASINASGSASFSSLNLKASGTSQINTGENHVNILTKDLTDTSQVIITFGSDYKPATKYWVTKTPKKNTFTVYVNYPVNNPTKIDWLIIN